MPAIFQSGVILPAAGNFGAGTGKYIAPALSSVTTDAGAILNNNISYVPFIAKVATTVNGIVWRNTGTGDSGAKVRVGLYASANGIPTTLLQAASEVTLTGAATTYESAITSTALTPGALYFAAILADVTPALTRITASNTNMGADYPVVTFITSAGIWGCFAQTFAYAALPASAGTLIHNVSGTNLGGYLMLKVA